MHSAHDRHRSKRPKLTARGPGRPTREQSASRHQELLDEALDLFLEHGFEATTIELIANVLRMSRRTIYARYGDKTELFKAALQQAIDEWVVPIERLRAAECDDLEETLIRVGRMWATNIRKPNGIRLVRIANTELFRMPDLAEYLWGRTAEPALDFLKDLFRRRLRAETLQTSDAEDAAAAYLLLVVEGSVQWAAWRKIADDEFDRQIVYRTRLFLHGARTEDLEDPSSLRRRLERLEGVVQQYLNEATKRR